MIPNGTFKWARYVGLNIAALLLAKPPFHRSDGGLVKKLHFLSIVAQSEIGKGVTGSPGGFDTSPVCTDGHCVPGMDAHFWDGGRE